MTIELKMPALSPTMETGTLARWLVAVGDAVKPGDVLAEIETDKATMEMEAVDEGRIASLLVEAGTDDVPVGTLIATLSEADADEASPSSEPSSSGSMPHEPPAAGGGEVAEEQPAPDAFPAETAEPAEAPMRSPRATALAGRVARARGIDLEGVNGDRVRLLDLITSPAPAPEIERAVVAAPVSVEVDRSSGSAPDVPHGRERLSSMRRTIARRLTESKRDAPHIYLTVDVRLDALLALRSELNAAIASRGVRLSVNDLFIKATAMALQAEPSCNVQFASDALIRFDRADISVAVSVPDGLVTPVVSAADTRSLSGIATTMRDLAERARQGRLNPAEYAGGTASISNLGMFGIDQFAAVLNPPQATILAIGAGRSRPWDVDGAVALATIVSVTGSFDHRAIDGADAARFLDVFRSLVEKPLDLTV